MTPDILFPVLGIPVSWLTNLSYEKIKQFSEKIEITPLQDLFIKTFNKSLDRFGKDYKEGVKKLKKSIKQKESEFLEIFKVNVKNYKSFISALRKETFHETVARNIVEQFEAEDNFKDVLVLIIRDCVQNYQAVFLKTMTEKQAIQLMVLLQGQDIDIILKSIATQGKAIASDFKKIVDREAAIDKKIIELKEKKKQIKILSITASPEGGDYILYEQEQDTLLEAFKCFDREEVFLDMPDMVRGTLAEIEGLLEDGRHDILHITAHGGINKKGEGILSFEDHLGKLQEVTGAELAKVLEPVPRIVILSTCHAAQKEPELMHVAQGLFEAGVETVIGMKKAVSHAAAVEFNVAFFKALCQKKTIKAAFEEGKQAVFNGEKDRKEKIPNWEALEEYEIPQLLTRDENLTVEKFSDHRIEAPGRPESYHFMGAKYLERGFIGRRQILRDIYKTIERGEGAVVLKGPGGIGKSALTTRAAANLRRKGYEFIVVHGETTIEQILEAISKKAAAQGVEGAREIYEANAEVNEKLGWFLDHYLLRQKVMIIFDDFEENQDEEKGDFRRDRLKNFLWFFRDCLKHKDTFLFFSTRYTLPGFDSTEITKVIPEFSGVEFRKMLLNYKALKHLDGKSIEILRQEIGGNPRALELLDKLAYNGFKNRDFTWDQLRDLFPELRDRVIHKFGKGDDFTPLFLDKLFNYLSESQRHILDILSIYRNPVHEEAIVAHNVSIEQNDRRRLTDLSLLECINLGEGDLYYVHRLTALYLLGKMKADIKHKYHIQAAQYFEATRMDEGKVYIENIIESRWHYIQAGQWNKAAVLTFDLDENLILHGYPQWSMELLQELYISKLSEENQVLAYLRLGNLYTRFGEYDNAISLYIKGLDIAKNINHDKHVSGILHQIGYVCQEQGRYDEALVKYEQSLEIRERISDTKGISESLHHIGIIHQYKGNYEKALKQYEKSLEILQRIGDTAGIASSLHQIGRIYEEKGSYEKALKQYEKSLEIAERIGDTAGIASTMGQMGKSYFKQNEFETALKLFIQAFLIFAKLESPYVNQAREDIAGVREKMPGEQFNATLKEFNLKPEIFDSTEAEEQQKKFMEFLAAVTSEAVSAGEKSSEEKEKLVAKLNDLIEQLPDSPEAEGLKFYFLMLLAYVNGEDYKGYMDKVPEEVKELFEEIRK